MGDCSVDVQTWNSVASCFRSDTAFLLCQWTAAPHAPHVSCGRLKGRCFKGVTVGPAQIVAIVGGILLHATSVLPARGRHPELHLRATSVTSIRTVLRNCGRTSSLCI